MSLWARRHPDSKPYCALPVPQENLGSAHGLSWTQRTPEKVKLEKKEKKKTSCLCPLNQNGVGRQEKGKRKHYYLFFLQKAEFYRQGLKVPMESWT